MANHCYNYVTITGNSEVLEEISNKLEYYEKFNYITSFFDFVLNKRTSIPSEKDNLDGKDYNYYGTKWWDYEFELYDSNLNIQGDSAWAPPLQFIQELCQQYSVKATFEYEEPGMGFAGIAEFTSKGLVNHDQMTYGEYSYKNDYISWFDRTVEDLESLEEEEVKELFEEISKYCTKSELQDLLKKLKEIKDE